MLLHICGKLQTQKIRALKDDLERRGMKLKEQPVLEMIFSLFAAKEKQAEN